MDYEDACDIELEFEEDAPKISENKVRFGAQREAIESLLLHRKFNYKAMMEMFFQSNKNCIFPCVFFDAEKYEKRIETIV